MGTIVATNSFILQLLFGEYFVWEKYFVWEEFCLGKVFSDLEQNLLVFFV